MFNNNIIGISVSNLEKEYYTTVLLNSKELTSSVVDGYNYSITKMIFKREKKNTFGISFYGNIENGHERRYIMGTLYDMGDIIYLKNCSVIRNNKLVYNFDEEFQLSIGYVERNTSYDNSVHMSRIPFEDFYDDKSNFHKLVRGKK